MKKPMSDYHYKELIKATENHAVLPNVLEHCGMRLHVTKAVATQANNLLHKLNHPRYQVLEEFFNQILTKVEEKE